MCVCGVCVCVCVFVWGGGEGGGGDKFMGVFEMQNHDEDMIVLSLLPAATALICVKVCILLCSYL